MSLADHVGASIEQLLHHHCRTTCCLVRRQPRGAAETSLTIGDIVNILDTKRETGERTSTGALQCNMGVCAESAQRIVRKIEIYYDIRLIMGLV